MSLINDPWGSHISISVKIKIKTKNYIIINGVVCYRFINPRCELLKLGAHKGKLQLYDEFMGVMVQKSLKKSNKPALPQIGSPIGCCINVEYIKSGNFLAF